MTKRKILIVDDESDARLLLRRRLEANHYSVMEAGDGKSALQQAREGNPDLIVLDLKMPDQDGIEVYGLLRKETGTEKTPVLFLTALASGNTMTEQSLGLIASTKHGLEMEGTYAIMGKPYDAQSLVEKIRGMLPE